MVAQRNGKHAIQNFHVGTSLPHSFWAQVAALYIDFAYSTRSMLVKKEKLLQKFCLT
jgi:hypothetical protein